MKKPTAVLVRLSSHLKRGIQRVARSNRRPTVEEIRIGLENHLAASTDSKSSKKA
jgi:hypothetical protein